MRHKTKTDDRYLRLKERNLVLELGKDVSIRMFVYSCLLPISPYSSSVICYYLKMHLLDLHSTSIWTTSTMVLYTLDVIKGDLDRIQSQGFVPKKRVVRSEEMSKFKCVLCHAVCFCFRLNATIFLFDTIHSQ